MLHNSRRQEKQKIANFTREKVVCIPTLTFACIPKFIYSSGFLTHFVLIKHIRRKGFIGTLLLFPPRLHTYALFFFIQEQRVFCIRIKNVQLPTNPVHVTIFPAKSRVLTGFVYLVSVNTHTHGSFHLP